ncbi:cyclic AMP response element-binding protein A [Copidosoma floridanum]|uniref:cyclic AMP response element-binding protein A n=1 Tax=Copidosoma floridanum TaxID=29053 RepID=UPI0006C9706E|nr:cyclic AMP response element-binding protein A [Copidosoma floridanum]
MSRASGRDSSRSSPEPTLASTTNPKKRPRVVEYDDDDDEDCCLAKVMKGEPLSPGSSSCAAEDAAFFLDDKSAISAISPHNIHVARFAAQQNTDSEDDNEELLNELELKVEAVDLPCEYETIEHKSTEESQELLPPTPPSTSCSDSESTVSASCSPERRDSHGSVHAHHHQNLRGCLQPRLYVTTSATAGQHSTTTRQPIHTPLISCQPKGSTGELVLTEEEKKTLIAEGYPVPTKLPLTKHEEKSLKKVRRKIKNKISAQESRRKKKEYVDGLERRVAHLSKENANYQDRLSSLESSNRQLQKELQRFQAMFKIQSL